MTEKGFVARVSGKNGNTLHITAVHPSREEAATAAFSARPKASKCSTSKINEGKNARSNIMWHERPAEKKAVKETVSFLIEDAFEKSELVASAQAILTKLQDTAEKIASVLPDDVMPIQDAMAERFGPDAAMKFNSVASDQLAQLVAAVQTSKTAIGNEVLRLKRIANGESGSDAAMDMDIPPSDGAEGLDDALPPDGPPGPEGVEGAPPMDGEEGSGPLDAEPMGGNFAGRKPKYESAQRRGRKLRENAMQHPNFEITRASFESFAPECAGLVADILDRIHHLPMAGTVRDGLVHVLQHVMEQALSPMVWDNPQAVLQMGLTTHFPQMPSNVDVKIAAEIDAIKKEVTRLAHKIADAHERGVGTGMPAMEARLLRNVNCLRESRNPDRMILTVFRRVLAECRSPTKAANGTARAFSIDVGDVVTIVREAKQKDVYNQIRALGLTVKKDQAGDHVVNYKGYKAGEGHFTDDLEDALGTAKQMAKKMPKAKEMSKETTKKKVKGTTKKKAKALEDVAPALMGKRMGQEPHEDPMLVTALAGQVPPGQPPVPGKPVKPLTPADQHMQKIAQQREDEKNKRAGAPMTPIGAKPNTAPSKAVMGMKPPGTVVTPANFNRM